MNHAIKRVFYINFSLGIILVSFHQALTSSTHCSLHFDGKTCPGSTRAAKCSEDVDMWNAQLVVIRPTPNPSLLHSHPEYNIITILSSTSSNCWDISTDYTVEPKGTRLTIAAFCNGIHIIFSNVQHQLESTDPQSCVQVITMGMRPALPCSPLGSNFGYEFVAGLYLIVNTEFGSLLMVKTGSSLMDINAEHRRRFEERFEGIIETNFKSNKSMGNECVCEHYDGYLDWIRNCSSFYDDASELSPILYMKNGQNFTKKINSEIKNLQSREDLKMYAAVVVVTILVLIVGIFIIIMVQCMKKAVN